MAGGQTQPSTDKITLAVIASKVDSLVKAFEQNTNETRQMIEKMDARMRDVEKSTARAEVEIDNTQDEMKICKSKLDDLQTRSTWWEGINTTMAVLAGVLGFTR